MAFFLVCEDPQRRLDAREISTLAHQVSLVRHILDNESLRRVMIADEVGLGKTVEAGLLLKELLNAQPNLRVIYFAPARLVSNVRREFDRLGMGFRQWSATNADARLDDNRIIASIHRAVHPAQRDRIMNAQNWDVIVVDECHHLSDWADGGGDPREKFRLVRDLIAKQSPQGRVVFLSGTPHQGHVSRFENLLKLLCSPGEKTVAIQGRVIFRTKDDIVDWDNNLLFPRRIVNPPLVVDLGEEYKSWISDIHHYYSPKSFGDQPNPQQRAAGWRCAQALQWAASSPQAGLGYLVRQAMRIGATPNDSLFADCLFALRPYRNGPPDEKLEPLFQRIEREVKRQIADADVDDIEDEYATDEIEGVDAGLRSLLERGLEVLSSKRNSKWDRILADIIGKSEGDKIVFFAQPIETVTAFAQFLRNATGIRPSLIIGGQTDLERDEQVNDFCRAAGPTYLVSSRAGGEGINLQIARRLVHIDVPWNPMDMEQRVGRVHRFGSRRNIIVDTLVVKDSREEHAYRVARDRLRLIASTMVDAERFESLFSRVICLLPPEELQDVLINGPEGPLTDQDQENLGEMVRGGYDKWREFDAKYSQQQKMIRSQDPGLAAWRDVKAFLMFVGKAEEVAGFVSERFTIENGTTTPAQISADVVRTSDGTIYACCDLGGLPAYGPNDQSAVQLGLNLKSILEHMNQAAFPDKDTGAAALRWPEEVCFPGNLGNAAIGFLSLIRVSLRFDSSVSWVEQSTTMHYFVVHGDGTKRELNREESRQVVDGLQKSTIRAKKPNFPNLENAIADFEQTVAQELRRPTELELAQKIRHAVTPVFACTIELK